jgi:hypothetical protein
MVNGALAHLYNGIAPVQAGQMSGGPNWVSPAEVVVK